MLLPHTRLSLLSIAATALAVATTLAAPASHPSEPPESHWQRDEECGFAGNPDLYGLGIRLAIYIQWISSLVVWAWYPDGGPSLMQTYLVFLLAVMLVVLVATVQDTPTRAVEIVVLTYIVFGGVYSMIYQAITRRDSRRPARLSPPLWLTLFCILGAASLYCSWFWIRGIHSHLLPTPCGTYMFFFNKFSVYDSAITKFFSFLSVLFAVAFVPQPLFYLATRIGPVSRMNEGLKFMLSPWTSDEPQFMARAMISRPVTLDTDSTERSKTIRYGYIVGTTLSILISAYSIIAVELTLSWNSIRDVYTINTTGQLVPFIIALTSLVRFVYKSVEHQLPSGLRLEEEAARSTPQLTTEADDPRMAVTKPTSLPTAEIRPCSPVHG